METISNLVIMLASLPIVPLLVILALAVIALSGFAIYVVHATVQGRGKTE